MGVGGPEGVLAAAALRCIGVKARPPVFRNDDERGVLNGSGYDFQKIRQWTLPAEVMFAATGVAGTC